MLFHGGHMNWVVFPLLLCGATEVFGEIDHNTINDDGSFSFRHANDDIGGHYHSAYGSPDNTVRGRYGSRNPATGQVEEVVYTAGPRGFRANGPKIHRKMDLAQYPPGPIGTPDDPLADPYDDPSYSFSFRTPDQSRSEDNDATGRVRGLYSYIDDVGERHSVRYAAGAGTGFEVSNAVPDNPANVGYTAPLYKSHPKARGKMSVQRGPNGSYKLIAAGPDHRRAESRGSDGLVRGTYSYLDDKGVQRTVEYIAGAGIGYRIVKNRVGPGTHINPSVSEFRLSDTDFKLANDFGRGAGGGLGSDRNVGGGGRGGPRGGSSADRNRGGGGEYLKSAGSDHIDPKDGEGDDSRTDDAAPRRGGSSTDRNRVKIDRMGGADNRGSTRYRPDSNGPDNRSSNEEGSRGGNRGGSGNKSSASNRPSSHRNSVGVDYVRTRDRDSDRERNRGSNRGSGSINSSSGISGSGGTGSDSGGYNYDPPSSNNYNFNEEDVGSLPPLVTPHRKVIEIDRERDWVQRHHDSTVIKNVGKWYIGLPPGQSVRAHVQNIDLLPLGGRRVPSPSEALRQDEIADMVSSLESERASYNS